MQQNSINPDPDDPEFWLTWTEFLLQENSNYREKLYRKYYKVLLIYFQRQDDISAGELLTLRSACQTVQPEER